MLRYLRNSAVFYNSWALVTAAIERRVVLAASRALYTGGSRCMLHKQQSLLAITQSPLLKSKCCCDLNYATSNRLLSSAASKIDTVNQQSSESDDVKQKPESKRNNNVIYTGTLARHVRIVKVFSLSTSVIGISLQPFIYQKLSALPVVLAVAVGGFASFFIYLTPVLLHLVSKRYVTEMTLDPVSKEYTATTYTFFLRKKIHRFTVDDVTVPNVSGLFTSLRVHGVPLFIDRDLFTNQSYFVELFKFNDPLDWEIVSEALRQDKDNNLDKTEKKL